MKEHTDEVLLNVKESTETVDSALNDEIVTRRAKIEGIFGERDEEEDMNVDVEGLERETVTGDRVMEDVVVVNEVSDDLVESSVVSLEKVEVVVSEEVVQDNVVVGDSKTSSEPLSKELERVEVSESVEVVADGDRAVEVKTEKEAEVLGLSKSPESTEGRVVAVEGLVGNNKVEDGVDSQRSLTEVVDRGTGEDNAREGIKDAEIQDGVDRKKEESLQSTVEDATNGDKKSGNGDSKMVDESMKAEPQISVKEEGSVMNERTGKDEALDSSKILQSTEGCVVVVEEGLVSSNKAEDGANGQSSLTEVVDGGTGEDNAHESTKNEEIQDGVDQTKEESLQSTVDDTTNGDSKMAVETINDEHQISLKEEGSVISEKTGKDEVVVHENAKNLDQKAEIDQMSKEDCLQSKTELTTDDGLKSENSKMDDEPQIIEEEIAVNDKKEDPESGLTKETMEQPTGSVQEVAADGDHVMDEKTVTDDGSKSEDSKMDDEPQIIKEIAVKDKKDDSESGLTKETVKEPTDCVEEVAADGDHVMDEKTVTDDGLKSEDSKMDDEPQITEEIAVKDKKDDSESVEEVAADGDHVMNEKSVKDDVLDSSKISQSLTMASLGLEDVDVVVVDEGLEGQNEAQDSVSVELSLAVNTGTCEVDPTIVTDEVAECSKVDEVTTISGDSSNFQEDQGLIAVPSNEGNEITASHIAVPDSTVGVPSTGGPHTDGAHGVLPANIECSYEEAHIDRAEDAGMDIDEVLGWKDEIPSVQEDEQKVDPTNKRKAIDPISETVEAKPSFEVGTFIQKVASQSTGPPLNSELADHVAGNTASVQSPGPTQTGNQAEMLSQLNLTAQDPMKGHSFVNTIIPFFRSHRAAVLSESRKRKASNENEPDEFELDDVKDSYWTDRIIQNHPDEQVLQDNPPVAVVHQIVAYEQDVKPPVKPTRRSNKKRYFSSNHEIEASEQSEVIVRRQQNLPTEVLMKFAGGSYFPSEIHLNKMFKRFGPLMESETEVDRQSGRARVVFKKCSDAEVAHSSAGKFNIFGSISVNYELNYTPLISYKPMPLPSTQDPPHAC